MNAVTRCLRSAPTCAIGAVPAAGRPAGGKGTPLAALLAALLGAISLPLAAAPAPATVATPADSRAADSEVGPNLALAIGKSTVLRLPAPIERISVGNPAVADVTLISGRELYLLGKTVGSTNVILWRKGATAMVIDVSVNIDAARLEQRIGELMPQEKGIRVSSAADSIVLSGEVSSASRAEQAVLIAEAFVRNLNRGLVLPVTAGNGQVAPGTSITVGEPRNTTANAAIAGARVVNLLQVVAAQQVMLEVKVAEVSKTLLDKLGSEFGIQRNSGNWTYSIINSLLTDSAGRITAIKGNNNLLRIDAEKRDGLVKVLAEPNIIAISGQEGSFLAGGKIFIPVARSNAVSGLSTITLEEKEFGVGLKFTPTVLDSGRINLRVSPEVSELSQTGSPFTSIDGVTAILPSFTTRRAQTTVQLGDGQSFVIAGLIKNNVTETIKRFPGLGEIPVLGALFRSNEFQTERSELMFVVTPHLVHALNSDPALPTDHFTPPSRGEFFLGGKLESDTPAPAGPGTTSSAPPPAATPANPARGGFEPR